ncbi:hypothetical protein EMIHUDRAFT_244275 [Emiliania huxleyi CCMP1516]|uniref:F-box domain-containing protein n=2 Tax=Emiliania huxleyi TaxID=2903 RepID=A0A0D3J133_EMIH1|nr:hypothetical protein EMIHUDRAFT_244275 [Emiliania huxleyi CCMP1516]EOD17218.1 hypothetical protein EMIHUDRAFT_244275 [Emiliania huxleyi CCMP1516]|eukprot:XP_005769647.1 hypothetical protein EMIHUDRAFT_244275 [Emiliania huxleyi CCMP1516]
MLVLQNGPLLPLELLGNLAIVHVELPNVLLLKIACLLDVDSLDNLAATCSTCRAVARSDDAADALVKHALPSFRWPTEAPLTCWFARCLCRTFQRLTQAADAADEGWNAVLWQASALGCEHGVLLALDRGAAIEYSGGRGNDEGTALWCAAKFRQYNVVKLLHGARANLEARGGVNTRSTPLWVAARQGHANVAELLLECGANALARSRNGNGHSVLDVAMQALANDRGDAEMADLVDMLRVM